MINQSWDIATDLEEFYIDNATTFFVNTPLDNKLTRQHEFYLLYKKLLDSSSICNDVVVVNGNKILGMGICYKVDYLSDYFGKKIGAIDGLVISKKIDRAKRAIVADSIVGDFEIYLEEKFDFVSVNVPSTSIELIQSLEEHGFLYAEGFNSMYGRMDISYSSILGDTIIRKAEESDFQKIEQSYLSSDFPSHLVTDLFFDDEEAKRLYVRNFQHTWENRSGMVWVAEIGGNFAGALIGKIDEELKRKTGIVTNARSGMGIIVDSKYRNQSVAKQLLIERDIWFREQGVEWQILGANISNVPMIRLMGKKGFQHASTTITMHKEF